MNDPLSVAAPVFQHTFDPVEMAGRIRSDYLKEQELKGQRFKELMANVAVPDNYNSQIYRNAIKEYQDLMDEGINSFQQGVDVSDVLNKKHGKQAMEYQSKLRQFNQKLNEWQSYRKVAEEAQAIMTKDATTHEKGKEAVDTQATTNNINAIRTAPTIEAARAELQKMNYNPVVAAFHPMDVPKYISENVDKFISPEVRSQEKVLNEATGLIESKSWEKVSPEQVKAGFRSLLANPEFKKSVEYQREHDQTYNNPADSNENYLLKLYGNTKVKDIYKQGLKGGTRNPKETTGPSYATSTEPIKTTISIQGNSYEVVGYNPLTFNQANSFMVSPGSGTLDIKTGRPTGIKGSIEFTPVNSAEYYVSRIPIKTPNGTKWPAGTILPDGDYSKNKNVIKKRFVEGTYNVKLKENEFGAQEEVPETVFIPYDNIKNELDKIYKAAKDIPEILSEPNYTQAENDAIASYMKRKGITKAEAIKAYEDYKKNK